VIQASEFSRSVRLDALPEEGIEVDVRASAEECRGLAERLDVVAVESLSGRGRFSRAAGGPGIVLRARLEAVVVQRCVVSLEPVTERIDEAIERNFLPPGVIPMKGRPTKGREVVVDPLEEEVDPLEDGRVDLGEVLVEELALALDPYPHAEHPVVPLPEGLGEAVSVDLAEADSDTHVGGGSGREG
jgi:hypothetical protein